MKPGTVHRRPAAAAYRSELVFKSAERLLASRPARRWPKGLLVGCGIGGLLGFALGIWMAVSWLRAPSEAGHAGAESAAAAENFSSADRSAVSGLETKAAPPAQPAPRAQPGNAAKPAAGLVEDPDALRAEAAKPGLSAGASADAGLSEPPPAAITWLLSSGPEVTLRGELRPEDVTVFRLESRTVEFSLRRRGQGLSGVVRYFSASGARVVANAVIGEAYGRTLNLYETSPVWEMTNQPATGLYWMEPRKTFVFEIPEKEGANVLMGRWFLGRRSGVLDVSPVLPW